MKKTISKIFFLRIAVSFLLVAFLVYKVPFSSIVKMISTYSLNVIFLAVSIHSVATLILALKWKMLLPGFSYARLLQFTFVGQFYAIVLPGQITGEIAKAYRVTRESVGNGGKVATSIAIDKIIGLMGVMLVTIFGLLFTDLPERNIWIVFIFILLISFVTVFLIFSSVYVQQKILSFLQKFEIKFSKIKKLFVFTQEMFVGFKQYLNKPILLVVSFLLAVLFQLLAVLIIYIFAQGLGIHIPIQNYLWIFGMVSLAVMLPVTIAGLGVREGLFVFFLLQFNVAPELALTLSLSVFSLQVFVALIGGIYELRKVFYLKKN